MTTLYKEQTSTTTSYVRAREIRINNNLSGQSLTFLEEKLTTLSDGTVESANFGTINEDFTPENAGETFDLLNPLTGEPLGSSASYTDLQVMLFSLYFHLTAKRDAN